MTKVLKETLSMIMNQKRNFQRNESTTSTKNLGNSWALVKPVTIVTDMSLLTVSRAVLKGRNPSHLLWLTMPDFPWMLYG